MTKRTPGQWISLAMLIAIAAGDIIGPRVYQLAYHPEMTEAQLVCMAWPYYLLAMIGVALFFWLLREQ